MSLMNKFRHNGRELQNQEFIDGSGFDECVYVVRKYNPKIGLMILVDPSTSNLSELAPFSTSITILFCDPMQQVKIWIEKCL